MDTLHFTIDIKAPKQKVWDIMLGDKTYRQWTEPFQPGSYFEGSWDKGSTIRFLASDAGKIGGLVGTIAQNTPGDFVSIEYTGEVVDGVDNTASGQQWAGAHENYTFSEANGVTTLTVDLEGNLGAEMTAMFEQMWPKALQKLKEMAEAS